MGFSLTAQKTTYVSSVIYNLAGDEADRPNYLKTVVVGKIISDTGSSGSLAETIQKSYLSGPGMRMRSFIKWGKNSGFNDKLGLIETNFFTGTSIDVNELAKQIPNTEGYTVNIIDTEAGIAEWSWWVTQYMCDHYPSLINTNWTTDIDEASNIITITFEDGTKTAITPANFDLSKNYLYAMYSLSGAGRDGDTTYGSNTILADDEDYPSVSGWSQGDTYSRNLNLTLHRTVTKTVSYSDGRPDEVSNGESDFTTPYILYGTTYTKTEYAGSTPTDNGEETHKNMLTMYQEQSSIATDGEPVTDVTTEEVDGVTVTTTTVTTEQVAKPIRQYRIDSKDVITAVFYGTKVYLYQYNTGNPTLDLMFAQPLSLGLTAPFIPIRVNNVSITDESYEEIYTLSKKAYKKATGAKFDTLIEKVEDNDSLGDIDYAYVVFGVPLNTKDMESRKYLYTYFKFMVDNATNATSTFDNYVEAQQNYKVANKNWTTWMQAQSDPTNPLYGTTEPVQLPAPHLPQAGWWAKAYGVMNYEILIRWTGMNEVIGSGMKDSTHKVGECWFEVNPDYEFEQLIQVPSESTGFEYLTNDFSVEHITLFYQESATQWRGINIWGLRHQNYVYNGKSITISAKEALADTDESGFYIPIENSFLQKTSLISTTQLSTTSTLLVLNCYQVVKQKWYQTGLFKVILVIAIIIITIYTGGAGVGLLGTAASVGAAVGLAGVAAIIVGTIANALAAMILMKIIGYAANRAFGEKIGAVVTAIATVVAVAVGGSLASGGTVAQGFTSLTTAQGLTQLTVAAGNGYAEYMQSAVQETLSETQALMDSYETQSEAISEKFDSVFGTNNGIIDPLTLTDATQHIYESMDSFMSRTLLTGADIAELSQTLLENFVDITTSTELDLN